MKKLKLKPLIDLEFDYKVRQTGFGIDVYDQNENFLTTLSGRNIDEFINDETPEGFGKKLLIHAIDDELAIKELTNKM